MGTLMRLLGVLAALVLPVTAWAGDSVDVLYAGSLVNMMEHSIGPAFDKSSGDTFQGFAGGSKGLANEIKGKLRRGDVFLSASPAVNKSLMGAANGDWVSWYVQFAASPLVIGYNPASKFANDLRTKPWYQVMEEPGIRIGRTDPKLDPKGSLTLTMFREAETYYKQPDLRQRILGAPENPAQVLPEETLVGRLQSGQLDVGFFYSTETAAAKIPPITLPAKITPAAHYTITILRDAPNASGATRFVTFLLGADGRGLMKQSGLDLVGPKIVGDTNAVPAEIRSLITAGK
ncbi:MAG: substrate-binding domain-containing protein [Acetobacteraceae bacterium]|nr:substrate-binding domain-containing protein [Acetobacteraceae bacterium]